MLLRASGESTGNHYDVKSVSIDGTPSGVEHGETLSRFAEAALGDDSFALEAARTALRDARGPEAVVDAAAVIATFSKMDRIADATGIPLDGPLALMTEELRDEIGLGRFASAENTPDAGQARRLLGRMLGRIVPRVFGSVQSLRRLASRGTRA